MRQPRNILSLMFATLMTATAQNVPAMVKQGEQVFSATCGSSYCHGIRGTGGGAPRLAARGFDQTWINNTVTRGVPGTSMPSFAATLSRPDLTAVVAYVASLNGISTPLPNTVTQGVRAVGEEVAPPALSSDATVGRDLFSTHCAASTDALHAMKSLELVSQWRLRSRACRRVFGSCRTCLLPPFAQRQSAARQCRGFPSATGRARLSSTTSRNHHPSCGLSIRTQ